MLMQTLYVNGTLVGMHVHLFEHVLRKIACQMAYGTKLSLRPRRCMAWKVPLQSGESKEELTATIRQNHTKPGCKSRTQAPEKIILERTNGQPSKWRKHHLPDQLSRASVGAHVHCCPVYLRMTLLDPLDLLALGPRIVPGFLQLLRATLSLCYQHLLVHLLLLLVAVAD